MCDILYVPNIFLYLVTYIHMDMTSTEKASYLQEFRSGTTSILITNCLRANSIDKAGVTLIIQYDVPVNRERYIHHIGRDPRFGRRDYSIIFAKNEDEQALKDIQTFYNTQIEELIDANELANLS